MCLRSLSLVVQAPVVGIGGGLLQLWALKHSSSFATTMSFFRFSRRLGPRDWKGSTKWRQNNTQSVAAASACSSFFSFLPRQRSFTLQQSRHNTHRQKKTAVGLARSLSLSLTHTHSHSLVMLRLQTSPSCITAKSHMSFNTLDSLSTTHECSSCLMIQS